MITSLKAKKKDWKSSSLLFIRYQLLPNYLYLNRNEAEHSGRDDILQFIKKAQTETQVHCSRGFLSIC